MIRNFSNVPREDGASTEPETTFRQLLTAAAVFLLFLMFGGVVQADGPVASEAGRPNILLITVDTLRPDHLSIYGFRERTTPNIDRLGKQGAVFDRAYCNVTWTTPSMATTLTGLLPSRHGFRSTFDRLPDDIETVAEKLHGRGYRNIAVVGSYPLDSIYGLDQGFDVYDDDFTVPLFVSDAETFEDLPSIRGRTIEEQEAFNKKKAFGKSRRTDAEVSNTAIHYLTEIDPKKPFFLWVHYFGPHSVPDTRKPGLRNLRDHVDTYPDKVVRSDREVGRLLNQLKESGLDADTMVIFHSDHGEALGEHKFIGHGRYLFEDNLRIPLIIRRPGTIPAGRRVNALVSTVDIAATILEVAGVSAEDPSMEGKSVIPSILEGTPIHSSIYIETFMPAHRAFAEKAKTSEGETVVVGVSRFGVLRYPFKLVVTRPHPLFDDPTEPVAEDLAAQFRGKQVFNVEAEPEEKIDLAPGDPKTLHELENLLGQYLQGAETADAPSVDLSDEQIEKLRALGYLVGP